jgi:CHAT domain-containing protein
MILGTTRIIHFATHGLADPDHPLDSFVALSLLENQEGLEHNGLLQAWEIIDHLKLNADLVVLSACVTAFGPERGGEGLISLSRAFQIAGARTVMASLWAVNDASTSGLMIRFYQHLLAGESKDQALQAAQLELIRGPVMVENEEGEMVEKDFSAPYHWAAFQLIGDWQ